MTTTTTHRPRQIRLRGQTHVAEGPVDMTVMYLMHHAFGRDLDAFARAVPSTPSTDRRAWRALAERWERFAGPLHHHHTIEDERIWPFLLERASSADAATLEAIEAEHEGIDPALAACEAGFRRLAQHADDDARRALAVRVAGLREALTAHLRHEETEAIPILQRLMTAEEWEVLDAPAKKEVSPGELLQVVPWVTPGRPSGAAHLGCLGA